MLQLFYSVNTLVGKELFYVFSELINVNIAILSLKTDFVGVYYNIITKSCLDTEYPPPPPTTSVTETYPSSTLNNRASANTATATTRTRLPNIITSTKNPNWLNPHPTTTTTTKTQANTMTTLSSNVKADIEEAEVEGAEKKMKKVAGALTGILIVILAVAATMWLRKQSRSAIIFNLHKSIQDIS